MGESRRMRRQPSLLLLLLLLLTAAHLVDAAARRCDVDSDCCTVTAAANGEYAYSPTICLNGTCTGMTDSEYTCTSSAGCASRRPIGWTCQNPDFNPTGYACKSGSCVFATNVRSSLFVFFTPKQTSPELVANPGQCPTCFVFVQTEGAGCTGWGSCSAAPGCCRNDSDCDPCYSCDAADGTCRRRSGDCCVSDGDCERLESGDAANRICGVGKCSFSSGAAEGVCSWSARCSATDASACYDGDSSTLDVCTKKFCGCCHALKSSADECATDSDCAGWDRDVGQRCVETAPAGAAKCVTFPELADPRICSDDSQCPSGTFCCGGGKCWPGTDRLGACTDPENFWGDQETMAKRCSEIRCDDENFCTGPDVCDEATGQCLFPEGACETSGQKCCGKTCVSRDAEFSDAECVPASGTEDPCREYGCHPVHGCISVLKPECRCDSDSDCKKFSGIDECVVGKCNTEDGTCDYSGRVECSEDPDDGNACTISECDPATGTCVPGKIDCGPADTGLPCALAACDPATGKCRSEEYPLCYDDPEITKLLAESKCLYPECDDSSGGCYVAALTCEYLDPCLEGACNPYTGRCTRNPVTCPADEKVAVPENSCLVTGCTFARDGCFSDIVVCDDRNECTNDFCTVNKISGEPECSVEPVNCDCDPDTERSNSDPCEWCWCSETSGCETEKVDCDDGNPATSDSCVPATGECVNVRKDCALGNDGDGNLCTESWLDPKTGICRPVDLTPPTEIELGKCILVTGPCDPSTGKFPTENKKCVDPANPCLTGTCDPETGECKNFLPRDCSPEDGNPCLDGTCDPLTGECDFVSVTCPPSVHGTCGISECRSCSGGCVDARKNCPEDGNFCTDDWCDSETLDGKCQSTPTAESRACSARSLPCLPYECDPLDGTCRAHPVTCDYDASGNLLPADECLLRYCDPAVGECVEKWICEPGECTDDGDCDDGNPCTEDICGDGIDDGKKKKCSWPDKICPDLDEDPCTVETCLPETGKCVSAEKNCDDGNECNEDWCDRKTAQCSHSADFACVPPDECSECYCVRTTGECECEISESAADCAASGDLCTNAACDPKTGKCVLASIPCPTMPCKDSICEPTTGRCTYSDRPCGDKKMCDVNSDKCVPAEQLIAHYGSPCYDPPAGGALSGNWLPRTCDDSNACTIDMCIKQTNQCSNVLCVCTDGKCSRKVCHPDTGECKTASAVAKDAVEYDPDCVYEEEETHSSHVPSSGTGHIPNTSRNLASLFVMFACFLPILLAGNL